MASDSAFPMSPDAVRLYRSGPPFLQRYLPFWIANLVERTAVLLVPLLTIAFPFLRGGPALYRWNVRRRLQTWYARLQRLEARMHGTPPSPETLAGAPEGARRDRGRRRRHSGPKAFGEQLYNLREHIEYVRAKLARERSEA